MRASEGGLRRPLGVHELLRKASEERARDNARWPTHDGVKDTLEKLEAPMPGSVLAEGDGSCDGETEEVSR